MFSRAEIAAWAIAVIGIVVMGVIALHGPFNHINVVHSAGNSNAKSNSNDVIVHIKIVNNPKTVGQYVPASIKILGNNETIKVTNASNAVHTLTDRGGAFNTGDIG